jgi:hypothetical protein
VQLVTASPQPGDVVWARDVLVEVALARESDHRSLARTLASGHATL